MAAFSRSLLVLFITACVFSGCTRARRDAFMAPAAPAARPSRPVAEEDNVARRQNDAYEWYRMRRAPNGVGDVPHELYTAGLQHVLSLPKTSLVEHAALSRNAPAAVIDNKWTSLGPGNIGARTRSLVINPQNPNIMYAGAVTGGVFKSTDGGATWSVLTDALATLNIGALALDPQNPSIVYAGTGEQWGGFPGVGIYKSTDAGATWTLLKTPTTFNAFEYINRLAISRNNSQRIYAATNIGLFTSGDGGNSWTSSGINASFYGCTDMTMRSDTSTDYLFAVCSGSASGQTFAVWRNTDAAGSGAWTNVFTTTGMGASVIALAPSQQTTIYLGAATSTDTRDTSGVAGIFRSTSSGDPGSWTTQTTAGDPDPFAQLLFYSANTATTYCSSGVYTPVSGGTWSRLLAVDPVNPNTVWIGGVDLYRSDDGGVTWGVASRWDLQTISQYSHADRHLMVFHPNYDGASNQTAFQMNDGGLWRTDNAHAAVSTGLQAGCTNQFEANTKVTWKHIDNSYVGTQFSHGQLYPGGTSYFGGTQDNGTNRGTDSGGVNTWVNLFGGDGGSVLLDPQDANRIFMEAEYLDQQRAVDGVTIVSAHNGITEQSASFPFLAAMAIDPSDGRNVYIGGTLDLWRSTDSGTTFSPAAPTSGDGAVSAVAVSPFDSNTVFFGTTAGYILQSSSALASGSPTPWTAVRPRNGNISSIAFDPTNRNVMYVTYSAYQSGQGQAQVYRSADGGNTWSPAAGSGSTGVGNIPTWRLLVDPRTPSTLYLAEEFGVMVSFDSGATWATDTGLPVAIVEDISIDATNTWLGAFTYGRGVWRTPLPGASVPTCAYSATPTSIQTDRFGGVFPVTIATAQGCPWIGVAGGIAAYVQSPSQGVGPGTAYVVVPANFGGAYTDTVTVAGTPVTVTQPAGVFQGGGADLVANAPALTIPAMIRTNTQSDTASAGDPVHSCTGSADFKTVWWKTTPTASGSLTALVRGDRLDVFGDFGIVVTAYNQSAPAVELACASVPKNTTSRTLTSIQFNVTAGQTYVIEISTSGGNTAQDGGNANLILTSGPAIPTVSVTPSTATLHPGGGPVQFNANVTAGNTGVRWSLSPNIGTISPTGVYTPPAAISSAANVTVTATSFAAASQSATATASLTPNASPMALTLAGVVNAASYQGGGVSPGELITIFGTGFGPATFAGLTLAPSKLVSTTAGSTQVFFDGVPSPMVYSVNNQVSAIVPYEVAGKTSTQMSIYYNGETSAKLTVPVVAGVPGLFTADASGSGELAMFNQDGSKNSASNPIAAGQVAVLFGTGEGQTSPAGVDGLLANGAVLPAPVQQVSVTIGGMPASVQYFGAAPGLVAGVFQTNVVVPAGVHGNAAVIVIVGTATSSSAGTMAVK